jgi:hypothetical protein
MSAKCQKPKSRAAAAWVQDFALAILSNAARNPLASLMASSLAQKCHEQIDAIEQAKTFT